MEALAFNFTAAIKYLEQPLENLLKSSLRESHLQNCKEVFIKQMPLKESLIRKVLFMIIHNLVDKKLLETELCLLLENFELLFVSYDQKIYQKFFFDEKEIGALIITQLLICFQHANKNISLKGIFIINKMFAFINLNDLKQFFPKICSEYFKALNFEYKLSNKARVLAVQGLEKIIILVIEKKKHNNNINFIDKYKNLMSFEKNLIPNEDEKIIRISSFLETLYRNSAKSNYNQKTAQAFMHMILETFELFISTSAIKWMLLLYLFCNNILLEKTDKEIISLYNKLLLQSPEQINKVLTYLKEELINHINSLGKLHLCLDSNYFLKTFRIIKDLFYLSDLNSNKDLTDFKDLKIFSYKEAENMAQILLKVFSIKSLNTKKIEISDQILELHLLRKTELEPEFIRISEEKVYNFQMRKIIDNFEIMNFDENIYISVNDMFLKIENSLAFYLFQHYFNKLAEFRYSFDNSPQFKEIISLIYLLNHLIGRIINISLYNRKWFDFIIKHFDSPTQFDDYLIKYIELLLGFDFLPMEDLRDNLNEYKVIFEMLKLEAISKCFSFVNHQYQANFIHKFNILYYMLEKYLENDYFLKNLTEKHLTYFIFTIEKTNNISEFLSKYIENIINRVILQIRSIHLFENKLQPFKVFNALLLIIEYNEKGIQMFHSFCMDVWTCLIKCYDKYYLLSDTKFIYLMLTIIKQIMKIISINHDKVTVNDQENQKFNEINLIRQILLRIKPLIVSNKNEILVLSNEIFKESLIFIHNKKLIVDEKPINFSAEDPPNVSIPDALGPIAFEFFPSYIHLLKNIKNLLGFSVTIEIFRNIANLNKEFFKNGHRFCLDVWPNLKNYFDKIGINDLEHNLKRKISQNIFNFIKEINIFHDVEFRLNCCSQTKEEIMKKYEIFKLKLQLENLLI